MPSMTFRFTTECEMTLEGQSYEEIYLQFKDFQHGLSRSSECGQITVCPPESDQMYFALDGDTEMTEIPYFKGSFEEDIANRCQRERLRPVPSNIASESSKINLSRKVTDKIPDVYW
ncbi:hypothetical protein G8770_15980 [Aestuariicella hydrocarbonica]|uniref:Uncharacterized protein n=1 Tax=Pseudomaricurvus hydrocarbonicus TaxID=1470433 RepID=A0A9E5MMN3_9GAMM|nr:hypothetical protein [Aestuariicella hydrocarbonica]NHO67049.1 hypothetical protein [Aestuariicella hydrocarbonica]